MCSRFGMIKKKERNKKIQEYRVWAPGKCNSESANAFLNKSENLNQNQALSTCDYSTLTGDTAKPRNMKNGDISADPSR